MMNELSTMHDPQVDMILFNVSNHRNVKVFPYAFVQVTAVARRFNIHIKTIDLSFETPEQWQQIVNTVLQKYQPQMLGITLRNLDSLIAYDYSQSVDQTTDNEGDYQYFPVRHSKKFISLLRTLTDIPIVVGGCGFSISPVELFKHLEIDYGIVGEPEPFFKNFSNILKRSHLHKVPNLVYRDDDKVIITTREYFAPSPIPEYDDTIFEEILNFYGEEHIANEFMPLEIMRGCPHHCSFCCEPNVYGTRVRVRDLDVVMSDLEFLYRHGLRSFWMVCSEINVHGHELLFALVEKIIQFNESRKEQPINWKSYLLPNGFSKKDWEYLFRSNFTPGWQVFASLDDSNLSSLGVPYRSSHVLDDLHSFVSITNSDTCSPDIRSRLQSSVSIFLGNAFITAESIRQTIKTFDEADFPKQYEQAFILPATRIYNFPDWLNDEATGLICSVAPPQKEKFKFVYPTFFYPGELIEHFGTKQEIERFFRFLETSIFSKSCRNHINWHSFLVETNSQDFLISLLKDVSSVQEKELVRVIHDYIRPARFSQKTIDTAVEHALKILKLSKDDNISSLLSSSTTIDNTCFNLLSNALLMILILHHWEKCLPVIEYLEFENDFDFLFHSSIYRLMAPLYQRYTCNSELVEDVTRHLSLKDNSIERLFLHYFLQFNNIFIREDYQIFLYD